jgi:FeS assembly SUF system protein
MADTPDSSPHRQPLTVLPHSGKVDQLREQFTRALVVGPAGAAPHVNRTQPNIKRSPEQQAVEEQVVQALKTVYDPEIPVDVYELGLIYDIEIDPENRVRILMTLTAPGCPVAGSLPLEVERKIEAIPEVKEARVELVWDPPWNKEMMSEAAQLILNL